MFDTPDPFNPFSVSHQILLHPPVGPVVEQGGEPGRALNIFYQQFLRGRVIWTDQIQLEDMGVLGYVSSNRYQLDRPRMFVVTPHEMLRMWQSNVGMYDLLPRYNGVAELWPLEPDPQFIRKRVLYRMPGDLSQDYPLTTAWVGENRFSLIPPEQTRPLSVVPENLTVGPRASAQLLDLARAIAEIFSGGYLAQADRLIRSCGYSCSPQLVN